MWQSAQALEYQWYHCGLHQVQAGRCLGSGRGEMSLLATARRARQSAATARFDSAGCRLWPAAPPPPGPVLSRNPKLVPKR